MIRGFSAIPLVAVVSLALAACAGAPVVPPNGAPGASAPSTAAGTPLPAGTYTSGGFEPAVTFTVPDGWEAASDTPAYLQLRPFGSEIVGIHVFRNPVAASQDPACPSQPEPGVGSTSSQLVSWIRERPGLVVSNPAMVTVGGLPGLSIDVGIAEGWTQSCPFANGSPTVPLFNGGAAGYHWIVAGNERLRLYVLDLPGGGTVVIDIDAYDGNEIDGLIAQALPIVKGMKFAQPAPASAAPSPAAS